MNRLEVYTDGSGTTAVNPGGWAFLIVDVEAQLVVAAGTGSTVDTTNNQMELMAAIEGLKAAHKLRDALYPGAEVILKTDSMYVIGVGSGKCRAWANWEFVQALRGMIVYFGTRFAFEHVKGHSGNQFNEAVDRVARHMRKMVLSEQEAPHE